MKKSRKKDFIKIITFVLILSIFTLPFFEITRIYAQEYDVSGGYSGSGSYIGDGSYTTGKRATSLGGVGAYIEVLSPAIAKLPLCQDIITIKAIKNLFSKKKSTSPNPGNEIEGGVTSKLGTTLSNNSLLDSLMEDPKQTTKEPDEKNQDIALLETKSIFVVNPDADKSLKEISKTNDEQLEVKKKELQNDLCFRSIGKMIAGLMLQKITASTIQWINSGNDGKALFLEDDNKYWQDVADREIFQFKLEIDDARFSPYGRDYTKSLVNQIQKKFQDNARYSANELIQETTPEYSSTTFNTKDFSYGGWNAWDAMTQVPANNPLGFHIIASNNLSERLAGTMKSNAELEKEALDRSEGFMGIERCVDPDDESITKSSHMAALKRGIKKYEIEYVDNNNNGKDDTKETPPFQKPAGQTKDIIKQEGNYTIEGKCYKWEYVTPGKVASEKLTEALGFQNKVLGNIDDINSAIAAIMDAAINSMTAKLYNEGLSQYALSGSYEIDVDNYSELSYSQVEKDFPVSVLGSNWLEEHPDFNIRTDLTQAIIDEQRIFQKKLYEQNIVLDDLIKTIHQLDYCVPGPHPGWEEDSERILAGAINEIPSKTESDLGVYQISDLKKIAYSASQAIGASVAQKIGKELADIITKTEFMSGIVSSVLGPIIGVGISLLINDLFDINDSTAADRITKVDAYYGYLFGGLTSVALNTEGSDTTRKLQAHITGKQDITNALHHIFEEYKKKITKYYTKDLLPQVTRKSTAEYLKIPGYLQTIENNLYSSATLNEIITRLTKIKEQLDLLANKSNASYEKDYYPLINEFASISHSMVTGNDIQRIVDQTRKSKEKIKYVYEDLLVGPYGCEQTLASTNFSGLPDIIKQTARQPYPFPIWYDYNFDSPQDENFTILGTNQSPPFKGGGTPLPTINDSELAELKAYTKGNSKNLKLYNNNEDPLITINMDMPNITPEIDLVYGPGFLPRMIYEKEMQKGCSSIPSGFLDCINITKLFFYIPNQNNEKSNVKAFEKTIYVY